MSAAYHVDRAHHGASVAAARALAAAEVVADPVLRRALGDMAADAQRLVRRLARIRTWLRDEPRPAA